MPVEQIEFVLVFFLIFLVSVTLISSININTLEKQLNYFYIGGTIPTLAEICIDFSYLINGSVYCYLDDVVVYTVEDNTLVVSYNGKLFYRNLSYIPMSIRGVAGKKAKIYKFGNTIYIS